MACGHCMHQPIHEAASSCCKPPERSLSNNCCPTQLFQQPQFLLTHCSCNHASTRAQLQLLQQPGHQWRLCCQQCLTGCCCLGFTGRCCQHLQAPQQVCAEGGVAAGRGKELAEDLETCAQYTSTTVIQQARACVVVLLYICRVEGTISCVFP